MSTPRSLGRKVRQEGGAWQLLVGSALRAGAPGLMLMAKMKLPPLSRDARDSIFAVALVAGLVGFGLLATHLGLRSLMPPWFHTLSNVLAGVCFAWYVFGIWRRRASNPNNPNKPRRSSPTES